jgi:hypothetical protein
MNKELLASKTNSIFDLIEPERDTGADDLRSEGEIIENVDAFMSRSRPIEFKRFDATPDPAVPQVTER